MNEVEIKDGFKSVKIFCFGCTLIIYVMAMVFLYQKIDMLNERNQFLEKENATLKVLIESRAIIGDDPHLQERYDSYIDYLKDKFR